MLLQDLISESVSNHPQNVCVVYDPGEGDLHSLHSLLYCQLWELAQELTSVFISLGVKNQIVGVCLVDCAEIPVLLLGLLSASCAFHPISLDGPQYTVNALMKVGSSWIVAHSELSQMLSPILNKTKGSEVQSKILQNHNLKLFKLDYEVKHSQFSSKSQDLAYSITTSGTTSTPRVVQVPHSCIVPNVLHLRKIFQMGPHDRVLLTSPLTFDPSIIDIFCTLSSGACLVIVPSQLKCRPEKLLSILHERQAVTVIQATPSLIRSFPSSKLPQTLLGIKTSLRVLAFGGEAFPCLATEIKSWLHAQNDVTQFYNLYGITEVSCWATCQLVNVRCNLDTSDAVLIGTALDKTLVKVIPFENGEGDADTGYIWIGSEERICYVGDEEREEIKERHRGKTVWRNTGDIGRLMPNGSIIFEGRVDDQVKKHGKRLNLRAIEMVCKEVPGVVDCCAQLHKTVLIAFVITESLLPTSSVAEDKIQVHHWAVLKMKMRQHIEETLPKHCVPDVFIQVVGSFPLTSHGKLDKKLLLKLGAAEMKKNDGIQIYNPWTLAQELWQNHLPVMTQTIRSSDNFIQLGGESLAAVRLVSALKNLCGGSCPQFLDCLINRSFSTFAEELEEYLESRRAEQCSRGSNGLKHKLVLDQRLETELQKKNTGVLNVPMKAEVSVNLEESQTERILFRGSRWIKKHGTVMNSYNKDTNLRTCCNELCKEITIQGQVIANPLCSLSEASPFCPSNTELSLKMRWNFDTKKCVDASPLVLDFGKTAAVFIGSHSGQFSAIDVRSGKCLWSITLPDRIESSACCSFCGTYIIVGCYDGCLYVLDSKTGSIAWVFATNDMVKCSPMVDEVTGNVLCGSHDGCLYCLNLTLKQCIWKCNLGGGSVFSSPGLNVATRILYASTLTGKLSAVNVDTGIIQWSMNLGKPVFSSLCLLDHHVLVGCVDGKLYFITPSGDIGWTFQTQAPIFSTPTVYNSSIFIGSHDHQVYCITKDGLLVWTFLTSGTVYATAYVTQLHKLEQSYHGGSNTSVDCVKEKDPSQADHYHGDQIIGKGKLGTFCLPSNQVLTKIHSVVAIASTNGNVYVLDYENGQVLAQVKLPNEVFSSPVVMDNYIIVGCRDNFVYCFEIGEQSIVDTVHVLGN